MLEDSVKIRLKTRLILSDNYLSQSVKLISRVEEYYVIMETRDRYKIYQ